MDTVEKICSEIGRGRICEIVGVKRQAISNAISENRFPSSWYRALKTEADDLGLECPMKLFAFREEVSK